MKSLPCYCCSVAKLCLTVCNSVDYSTSGSVSFIIFWSLLKFMSIEEVMPSNHFILCCSILLLPSQHQGLFQWVSSSHQVAKVMGVSAPTLPMNIQGWFPLGMSGLISLLSKELSRVFSSTTIQKHQFFGTQPFFWSNCHIHTWLEKLWKNHSFEY